MSLHLSADFLALSSASLTPPPSPPESVSPRVAPVVWTPWAPTARMTSLSPTTRTCLLSHTQTHRHELIQAHKDTHNVHTNANTLPHTAYIYMCTHISSRFLARSEVALAPHGPQARACLPHQVPEEGSVNSHGARQAGLAESQLSAQCCLYPAWPVHRSPEPLFQ